MFKRFTIDVEIEDIYDDDENDVNIRVHANETDWLTPVIQETILELLFQSYGVECNWIEEV